MRLATRTQSDEAWVLDLCDAILGEKSLRQHRFDWLRGDPSLKTGRRAKLPVDAYWPNARIVVEYHERQHYEPVAHFDKPDRLTATGVPRREQRARYDRIRDELIPRHDLGLVVVKFSDLGVDSRGRLRRDFTSDLAALTDLLAEALCKTTPRRSLRQELARREVHARALVGSALGTVVRAHDSGARPGMVDAEFEYRGHKAALEVTRVLNSGRAAQRNDALSRNFGAGLSRTWYVTLHSWANIKKIHPAVVHVLRNLEAGGQIDLILESKKTVGPASDVKALQAGGVRRISRLPDVTPGKILYAQSPMVGVGLSPNKLSRWVDGVVHDSARRDNVDKLARHDAVDERHLFLWAGDESSGLLWSIFDLGVPPDAAAPSLPDSVTHVWVASDWGGCIAWFPDRGWWLPTTQ